MFACNLQTANEKALAQCLSTTSLLAQVTSTELGRISLRARITGTAVGRSLKKAGQFAIAVVHAAVLAQAFHGRAGV